MSFKLKLPLILITFFIGLSSASLAQAAFPTIAASNSGNSGGNITSHTVNLPTGISSGNLLIVSFSNDGSATVSWPTGWTGLFSTANGTANRLSVAYRVADGSEGTTITVGTSGSESSAHTSYRITGHDSSTAPVYGTATTGSSTTPDPPSLTPSWGAADTLWLSVYGWDSNATNSSYPTNYSLGQVTDLYNNGPHGTGIASAGYNLNASIQDPGTATLSATETWVANTLAIRPMTASNITLGSGTDPTSATVAPGSGIRDAGAFTLQSDVSNDSVTALTVTLASSGTPYDGVGEVRITSNDGSTTYFSAVSNPSSNTVSFSGGTAIPITTTQTQFKIRITPKTHANMPVPAGASYDLSPYVSDWTLADANNKTGSDSNANTLTIDNTSPNGATSTSGTGGTGNVALNWTTSSSTDFSRSVVLRWASSTPGSEVPAEGTDYTAGNTISTATVACVRTADSASTAITDAVDGSGGGGGCLTTTLAAGSYSYKVFQKDSNGNYDTGVTFTGSPFTVTSGTVTQIYRSVGPGATGALANDGSHASTVTVASGTATFSVGFREDIGVGDAVIIDTGGTDQAIDASDTLLFIKARNSATSYQLQANDGSVPGDIAINDTYQIYRAYTSLANAEAGTKNTSIPIAFNGGNRDLVTNDEQWNIACYANGTTADTTAVTVDGWTTDSDNFIKIYTPTLSTEVGVSQRHSGKWDGNKYKLTVGDSSGITIIENFTKVIGLQILIQSVSLTFKRAIFNDAVGNYLSISDNIISGSNSVGKIRGIIITADKFESPTEVFSYIKNNIVYDFKSSTGEGNGIGTFSMAGKIINIYEYNNTVYNCDNGIGTHPGSFGSDYHFTKNNITQNCTDGFYGSFDVSSDFNISDISGDAPNATFAGGTADVQFVNEAGYDFHLAQTDTAARGAGANLTADANLPFSTDIDGQLRNPSGVGWDIGADEGTVEFVSTVMQTGGNFSTLSSWEDAIDSDLVADTTRVFAHGGITGTIVGGNTVTGLTSGATATVVYATSTQILLHTVSGIFQSGETLQVTVGNSVVISDNGNPASAVAKIDGAWSVADTTAVTVDGWASGPDNYIKIYTAPDARHNGKWDEGKYRLGTLGSTGDSGIAIEENYVCVDGLQVYKEKTIYSSGGPVFISGAYAGDIQISNSIIRAIQTLDGYETAGISIYIAGYHTKNFRIYNNIFYGFKDPSNAHGKAISATTYGTLYLFNNTITNSYQGVSDTYSGTALKVVAKNNISNNNVIDYFSGTFDSSSSNNISSDSTAPGTNSKTNTTVSFVSTTAGSEDFHLSQSDTVAKDAGTDLSTYFSTDIDGATRTSVTAWDIGADEVATQIFRSVGPSATGLLASDSSHANTVTLTSGVATFSVGLPDNIGVGDAVIIDTNGGTGDQSIASDDTLLFIHSRTSSTSYTLRTHTGSVPGDISVNDTYSIYRAHTSLANAEAGTINSTLSTMGFTAFNGGNRDLLTNNEEWNITCYANGTTADTVNVVIADWDTGAYNYLKIYTPISINEVGVSQRHRGRRDDNYYNIKNSLTSYSIYSQSMPYVEISGLQVLPTNTSGWVGGIRATSPAEGSYIKVHDNIIAGLNPGNAYDEYFGIHLYEIGGGISRGDVYNNIVYNFKTSNNHGFGIYNQLDNAYVYNNTVYNSDKGIVGNWNFPLLKNNIVQDCTDGYYIEGAPSWNASSDFNISDLAADAPGTNSKNSTNVLFIDETNGDFHLSQSDTAAKNAGTDLNTYFTTDIDGASRNASINNWDIGADETATRIFRSVGPSATGALASDSSHANTVTLTSGVATFSAALADNIGVGDAVIIDTGGTDQSIDASDTLLFIHSRTSSTSYTLRMHTGATPSDIPINDTYSIYRAYTSLYNAEAGTKNTSIPITFNGGNRDLVTNNEEWNIACYANGTTADTTAVDIYDWNTAQQNFVKIYTPVNTSEVGVSQRHSGKWDESKYILTNSEYTYTIIISSGYVFLDGLQVYSNVTYKGAVYLGGQNDPVIKSIKNSILKSNSNPDVRGIYATNWQMTNYIYNNLIIDFSRGIHRADGNAYIYNNTVVNSNEYGIFSGGWRVGMAKNNIVQNCANGFEGAFTAGSDYNISDISGDAPNATFAGGTADVQFVNEAGYDFHLAQTDTAARGAGANLTAEIATSEYLLAMTNDIDGQLRNPSGAGWDIGADEGTVEFVSTVMQSGGNFSTLSSWEDAIDSDLVADTTRVFSHGGITGTIVGGNTVTGLTSGATATVVYATSTQILLHSVSGIFQAGETVQVSSGNNVVISDNGNPASAVAKIDGAWTAADTTAVSISGWISGPDNYIKIYTAPASRHSGKWDEGKYRLQVSNQWSSSISLSEDFLIIDGIQIAQLYDGSLGGGEPYLIRSNNSINKYNSKHQISNNIIKSHQNYSEASQMVQIVHQVEVSFFNNIIIDAYYGINNGIWSNVPSSKRYIYNNTIINPKSGGFEVAYGGNVTGLLYLKNNIVQGTNANYNIGSSISYLYDYQASNNISSDATAPGTNSKTNTIVSFVSTTLGAEDFHLAQSDTAAKNAGTDLSTYFTTDIDGATRNSSINNWDIGADETATQIFRSVGPSATGLLDSDNSHADELLSITSGVATFEVAVADNIGVGDVVIIDTGGTDQTIDASDTLLFISGRNSSTSYNLRTHTGAVPANITSNDTWQIYRAYTSLANAEAGTTINSGISGLGFSAFTGGDRDLLANNEEWNIACYANGTTADATAVTIDGWNTGASNFIKVYTPVNSNEVGVSQRHSGKWDDGRFKLEINGGSLTIFDWYVNIDGLQIRNYGAGWGSNSCVFTRSGVRSIIENSIMVVDYSYSGVTNDPGIYIEYDHFDYFPDYKNSFLIVRNNIIYSNQGVTNPKTTGIGDRSINTLLTLDNNTISDCNFGIVRVTTAGGTDKNLYRNNIVQGSAFDTTTVVNEMTGIGFGSKSGYIELKSDCDNNISNDSSAPNATFTGGFAEVQFIDEANKDFHLSQSDTAAKDAGTDLSTYFTTDIDGASRNASINAWDIGADETATRIFRSVGPSATGALANDGSHARTVTLTGGVATFSVALADNIGVGDAVIIDTGGTDQAIDASDTLLFVKARNSSTSYELQANDGSVPGDIAINDTYSIYRAYTSLANAEVGTKNTSIPITFNGGNRDLLTNNEQWNIACYANGATADTTAVTIDGWNTAQQTYLKVYTPVNSNEVGFSQRHSGKWDDSKYNLKPTATFTILGKYIQIEGLQVQYSESYQSSVHISGGAITFSNSIIIPKSTALSAAGIMIYNSSTFGGSYIFNNIIYGLVGGGTLQRGIYANVASAEPYVYNNTVVNCSMVGIVNGSGRMFAKNNLSYNNALDYDGLFQSSSNNLSKDATAPGTDAKINQTVNFVNEAGKDFHLAQTDTAARGAGANLTAEIATSEYLLAMTKDIDGQLRNPSGAGWDIGADEGTVEFVSTVMQSGGNFSTLSSWEDAIDSDLVASTTRVFSHGGITGTIVGGNTVTGLTSGATATVVYATSTQILLHTVSGIFQAGETIQVSSGNSVVISDNGNPASAVAKIDGAWSVADTSLIDIDGWITGFDNYVRIYTTPNARHSGKWDSGKYRFVYGADYGFFIRKDNVFIDGIQIEKTGIGDYGHGITLPPQSDSNILNISIANNIIKSNNTGSYSRGIQIAQYEGIHGVKVYNNMVYNFYHSGVYFDLLNYSNIYIFSNTVVNSGVGIYFSRSGGLLKNNIVQGGTTNYQNLTGSFLADSSNNISSDATAPGSSGSKINAEVKFVSTESGNEDFHLHPDDRFAIDGGTDLSTYFSTDIDGQTRLRQDSGVAQWDIGADETATRIYRSVGPGKTDTLDSDSGHTRSLTELKNGVATFSAPLPDNVGVGDVVIIDTAGTADTIDSADTLLFIHSRTSSTSYTLRTHTGAIPSDITINDTYQIYRAHTSLANAEAGTINSTLSTMGFSFNGGNRDLVANNEQWNIACYANGTTADGGVSITGWTTSHQNYIKLYTPVSSNEVGVSQRHGGVWDNNKYSIFTSSVNGVHVYDKYVKVDGLQIKTNGNWRAGFWVENTVSQGSIYISNNLITTTDYWGIFSGFQNKISIYASNNIIYDSVAGGIYQYAGNALSYYYNNTINGMPFGFGSNGSMSAILVNNITQNCTDGYSGTFDASSDYNISDLAADAPGTNSKNSTDVLFLDEANDDFRLSSDDTAAKGAGLNLSTDANLSFFDDIRGQSRPASPTAWSIGASEPQSAGKIKLEGTQIKMEGDAKFE